MSVVHFAILSAIGTAADGSRVPQALLDFPHQYGPGAPTGTVIHVERPRAKAGTWVEGDLTEYALAVVTEGIRSMGAEMYSDPGDAMQVSAAIVEADETLGPPIHQSAATEVLAAWADDFQTPVTGYESWLPDAPISASRWTRIRNGLVALGGDAAVIDGWRTAHPAATPRQFWVALRTYLV